MIAATILTAGLGILISVMGIINMTGNISSLHQYHRQRVSEEDRKPFGKLVGLGTLIIGISVSVFAVLQHLSVYTENEIFVLIGTAELLVSIVIGLIISFYAMKKYNGGIF